jgi:hypothetical protein
MKMKLKTKQDVIETLSKHYPKNTRWIRVYDKANDLIAEYEVGDFL